MNNFEFYLRELKLSEKTISTTKNDVERFLRWVQCEDLQDASLLTYTDILSHVKYLKSRGVKPQTINVRLNAIRKYYDSLKASGIILKNPIAHLHIKGKMKTVVEHPLNFSELEYLYSEYSRYSQDKPYHLRNTAMLGLMVWQGLDASTLLAMRPEHLDVKAGKVYAPSTRRGNSRELPLDARQILVSHQYLGSLPMGQQTLIAGSVYNILTRLNNELRGINPVVRNLQHIRASVLIYWLKLYDKRRVQYMAGHKWISSTEEYERQEISVLDDELRRHHPFG